jgi:hypothetical protein
MGTNRFIATTYFRSEFFPGFKNSNPAQISLKHSSQLTNKTTLAIRHSFSSDMYFSVFYMYVSVFILSVKLAKIN